MLYILISARNGPIRNGLNSCFAKFEFGPERKWENRFRSGQKAHVNNMVLWKMLEMKYFLFTNYKFLV